MRHLHLVALLALMACGDESTTPPDALPAPMLTWAACPIITGGTGAAAECGEADVPADWGKVDGARIHVFVKRVGRIDAPTQMWLLNGGPGASGADFDALAEALASDGSIAVYIPDHRGTGRSTRLGCAGEADASPGGFAILDEEWDACVAELVATHGANLANFNTTQAAHDLAWLLEQTARAGAAVNVWGGSYGTRWAQRYLQLRPDQASSITLMGVVTADRHMADYDQIYDDTARAFLTRCSEDAFCSSRLGATAAVRARQIWDSLDSGHCAGAQFDKRLMRTFFASLLLSTWEERALIPAVLYRLERCNPGDVAALRYLRAVLMQPATPSIPDRLQSSLLGSNISINEFWLANPPSIDQLREIDARAIVSFGSAVRIADHAVTWPRYPLDDYAGRYPETSVPVLIINGEFDPATPLAGASEVATHYTRANQALVIGPDATHAFSSPTTSGYWCFLALMVQFARTSAVPPSCANLMLPMDFRGTAGLAAYFGTTDLWDGGPTLLPPPLPASALEVRRRMARPNP